nr:MAG TPA: hypothetical protein [Caudoviricetes sp.]
MIIYISAKDFSCISHSGQSFSFFQLFTDSAPYTFFESKNYIDMDEKMLTRKQESEIKEKALRLKEEKKLRKIYPMVVFGETDCGEKEVYVAYMGEPTFPQFSKFMAASKKDEVMAMRTLARDCFIDGDRELVDNDSLFLFGLMGQLSELITTRQSVLVN